MESLRIIALCVGAAILYGTLHDQVTARVCVEYFTIGHPPVFDTDSPTLLAFGWGVLATWWVGLFLGVWVALAFRIGKRPRLPAHRLVRPLGVLLATMGLVSLIAGVAGFFAASTGIVWLEEPMKSRVPVEKHIVFLTDLWAHLAAYSASVLGGIAICRWAIVERRRLAR